MGDIKLNLNPRIPKIEFEKDKTRVNLRYMLISPYASAHIYWNEKIGEIVYEVEEPVLTKEEKENLEKIEEGMRELINVGVIAEKSEESLIEYLEKTSKLIIAETGMVVSKSSYDKIFYYIHESKLLQRY